MLSEGDLGYFKVITGKWRIDPELGLIQGEDKPCRRIILMEGPLRDCEIEVEVNALESRGGQHIIFKCDENAQECYGGWNREYRNTQYDSILLYN